MCSSVTAALLCALFPVRDPEGGLKLFCKGADLVIFERLQANDPHRDITDKFLEVTPVILRLLLQVGPQAKSF